MAASEIRGDDELEAMIRIAGQAAARVAELYRQHQLSPIDVELKGPGDPVTVADKEANALITAALAEQFPGAGIVAEEDNHAEQLAALLFDEHVFFVDPLDGTREFVDRNPEFAVMIGLAVDGRAVAGVVHLPMEGLCIAGRVGARAFVQRADGERSFVSVSGTARFEDARMMVSRAHRPAIIEPLSRRLGIRELTPCGSVGVKAARIVLGEADMYVHAGLGIKRWDSCAPEALLAAAGGRLSDLDGAGIDYRDRDLSLRRGLLASNGILHPGTLSAIGWAEREVERLGDGRI